MADVGCDGDEDASFDQVSFGVDSQVEPLPEGGFPDGGDEEVGDGDVFEEAGARFDLADGVGVEPDACPEEEGVVVAVADIHILRFDVGEEAGVFAQVAGAPPTEGFLSLFECPDVGCSGGEDGEGGFGVDQSAGDLPDGAVAADGEDRIVFLPRGLMRGLDGVGAAEGFGDVDVPACVLQRFDDAADVAAEGEAAGGGVVEEESFAHGRIIADGLVTKGS